MTAVTHIVLVSFLSTTPSQQRALLRGELLRLRTQIPLIESLEEGASISPEGLEDGFDYGFVMRFASAADRDAYLADPAHQHFGGLLTSLIDRIAVFDLPTAPAR